MKRKDLMLKLIAAVIALVLVWTLNPIPVQAISVEELAVEPERAANQVGTNHTVTAVATLDGEAVPGLLLHFSVIRGPNSGVNGNNITDVNGEASFTYTSNGSPGIDTIQVETLTEPIVQNWAKKVWLEPTSGQIETDVFLQCAADIRFFPPGGGDISGIFTGITVVEVDLGSLGDSDSNGLEEVSAEIIMMELTGDHGGEAVLLWLNNPSVGKIEELTNNTSGVLDLPPFAASGTAVSTFEFNFSLICLGLHFGSIEPVSLAAIIDHKPPEAATWYSENNPVIHMGGEEIPGPHDMHWNWFVLGEYSPLPEVQLELLPESATNPPGTDHTVTAVYTLNGLPLGGKLIGFEVDSGPNDGEYWQGYTDAEGKATFTYTGDGGEGTDIIQAGTMMTWDLGQYIHAVKVWETPPPPNQPPVANDDAYSTDEDTTLLVVAPGVLGNDSDADGDLLTAVLDTGSGNGTLTFNADGSFTYTPDSDFNGIDSFTYHANDGSADSNTATVNITVDAVNDPPVAVDDAYATDEDTTLNIAAPGMLGNDSDPDGDPLTVVVLTVPQHGSGSIGSDGSLNYMPDANFSGSDTFSYKASDGAAESNIATVTITVNPINDPPVAGDDAYSTDEDTPLNVGAPGVLGNDSDPEGDTLTAILVTGPSDGALTFNGDGSFTYMPDADFSDSDSFTYTANDGFLDSNIATVTITVDPVNNPPAADDDYVVTDEDTQVVVGAPGLLANDSDPDVGDTLTVIAVDTVGTIGLVNAWNLDGSFTYDPNRMFEYLQTGDSATDSFMYTISDGKGGSDTATVTIAINGVNDPPVAVDDSVSVDEGGHIMVDVLSNDTDPDSTISYANVTVLAGPSNGTAVVSSVGINYTHDGSEPTSDTFIYQVEDGAGGSDNATVTVNINPVNDPPVADPNGPYSGTVGVPVTFYGSNSSDCDGTIVSYDWDFGDGAIGSGVSPAHNYAAAGIYTVTLTVIDNDGASHMATTSVDIAKIEPEEMIENLVDEIDGMDLPEGIKNGLTASLDTAMKVLEDSNQKNDVAAINVLKAFIKKVEAQCDKKIPEEVADDLIAKAQNIIVVLSLGP